MKANKKEFFKDILSVKETPITEIDDEVLLDIYQTNPNWVCEHRPDWVKKNYPHKFH
jgi:hypothetical protein